MEKLPQDVLVIFPDKYILVLFSQTNKLLYGLLNCPQLWTRITNRALRPNSQISLASIGYVYDVSSCRVNSHLTIFCKPSGQEICWDVAYYHRNNSLIVLYHQLTDDSTLHDGIVVIENVNQSRSVGKLVEGMVGDLSTKKENFFFHRTKVKAISGGENWGEF